MAEVIGYREPVFTFDHAQKVWGESYWALSGKAMLEWVLNSRPKVRGLGVLGWYDHRPFILPVAVRRICWCENIHLGEVPKDITDTYEYPLKEFPQKLEPERREEYLLQKSWLLVNFKWDTMSIAPHIFNLLLAKILALADYNKIGLVVFDTKDLYVNYNPIEWLQKYDMPYPVEDLDAQKTEYERWLTWSGFKRFYDSGPKQQFIGTPWYFRAPVEGASYGSTLPEYPPYKLHPLSVTGGLFYPTGLEETEETL